MRWVFQLYDADQSGEVSMSEMVILFAGIYQLEGIENKAAVERAEVVFGNLDINGDGDITEEEFVQGCLKDEDMVRMLQDSQCDEAYLNGISTPRL